MYKSEYLLLSPPLPSASDQNVDNYGWLLDNMYSNHYLKSTGFKLKLFHANLGPFF